MKQFTFYVLAFAMLFFSACQKEALIEPKVETQNQHQSFGENTDGNTASLRSGKSNYKDYAPWYLTQRVDDYNIFSSLLKKPTFEERWGNIVYDRLFHYKTKKGEHVQFYMVEKKNKINHIILAGHNDKGVNGVYIISKDSKLTTKNIKGTPVAQELVSFFSGIEINDEVIPPSILNDTDLPAGCYAIVTDCGACPGLAAVSIDCNKIVFGGNGQISGPNGPNTDPYYGTGTEPGTEYGPTFPGSSPGGSVIHPGFESPSGDDGPFDNLAHFQQAAYIAATQQFVQNFGITIPIPNVVNIIGLGSPNGLSGQDGCYTDNGEGIDFTLNEQCALEKFLQIDADQSNYIINGEGGEAIVDFLIEHNYDLGSVISARNLSKVIIAGLLEGPYSEDQMDEVIEMLGFDIAGFLRWTNWCAFYRAKWIKEHPGEICGSICLVRIALKAQYQTYRDAVHTAFDICGLIPAAGIPCDLINGVIYTLEGEGVNATFSFAAALPIWGWLSTTTKRLNIAIQTAPGKGKILNIKENSSGILEFSHNSSFREILNMSGSTWANYEAHHLLPKAFADNPIIQKAAKSTHFTFHMNHPKNGIKAPKFSFNYPDGTHAWHPNYNNQIQAKLTDFANDFPNATPSETAIALEGFQKKLRLLIENNPNIKINALLIDFGL